MGYRRPYDEEFKQRAVRLVTEMGMSPGEVAKDLGCSAQAIRDWRRQAEIDAGEREGLSSESASGCASWSGRTAGCGRSVRS